MPAEPSNSRSPNTPQPLEQQGNSTPVAGNGGSNEGSNGDQNNACNQGHFTFANTVMPSITRSDMEKLGLHTSESPVDK
jgi:hypothetical protein